MSIDYMFSGTDPTGRDDLIPRRRSGSGERAGVFEGIARTARTATVALASVCTIPIASFAFAHVDAVETAPVTLDPILQAIWGVRSEREQPTDKSRLTAAELLGLLRDCGLEPDRVLADHEGGVALYVFGEASHPGGVHARYARLVATNDGEVAVLQVDRDHDTSEVWDVPSKARGAAVERVRAFVEG